MSFRDFDDVRDWWRHDVTTSTKALIAVCATLVGLILLAAIL